jgi:hypothetical protein
LASDGGNAGEYRGGVTAGVDGRDPFEVMSDVDRAELHAALAMAEEEIANGQGITPDELLRRLRAAR